MGIASAISTSRRINRTVNNRALGWFLTIKVSTSRQLVWLSSSNKNPTSLSLSRTDGLTSQQTQSICITFVQCRTNVEDVGPTMYKCYTNILYLLVWRHPPSLVHVFFFPDSYSSHPMFSISHTHILSIWLVEVESSANHIGCLHLRPRSGHCGWILCTVFLKAASAYFTSKWVSKYCFTSRQKEARSRDFTSRYCLLALQNCNCSLCARNKPW